jgi:urate oxidase
MAKLGSNCYGKHRVRLSRITRSNGQHDFNEWSVNVLLEGDFATSFTEADNSKVLPTDTMKNTVYYIARRSQARTIEEFAMELGDYLISNNPQVFGAKVEIQERAWERITLNGLADATTFKLGGPELHTVRVVRDRDREWSIRSGVDGLTILKTAKSAFTGFIKDKLTTLKPATDRIFGTCAKVKWDYGSPKQEFANARARIMHALLKEFAGHDSLSVQHTLYDMGKAALNAAPEIERIELTMPNLHHLLADLSPFGQDNPNHIFIPIDEPHGYIEAMVER